MYHNVPEYQMSLVNPVKGHGPGKGLFLGYTSQSRLAYQQFDIKVVPLEQNEGIKLLIHDPYELVSNDARMLLVRNYSYAKISIIPRILTFDESLVSMNIEK